MLSAKKTRKTKTVEYVVLSGVKDMAKRKQEYFSKRKDAMDLFQKLDAEKKVHVDVFVKEVTRKETSKGKLWNTNSFSSSIEENISIEKIS